GMETRSSRGAGNGRRIPFSYLNVRDFASRNEAFTQLAGYSSPYAFRLARTERTERVFAELVTANYFECLGLRPALGRFFAPEEDGAPGAHPVAVIGYTAWQQRFGASPEIIGQTIRLNNATELTVIGVAPEGFVLFGPDLWIPAAMSDPLIPSQRGML